MSWHGLTDRLALQMRCPYCHADVGSWCVTVRSVSPGRRASWLHASRTRQLWDLERRGYLYGMAAGLWNAVTILERGGTTDDVRARAELRQADIYAEESTV